MSDLLVRGGRLVTPQGLVDGDVWIQGGLVHQVGAGLEAPAATPVLDATGKLVLPGLIDTQVHFREPGLTHKADLQTESLAAIAGGVTAFCEMPNTKPATVTPEALQDKLNRAAGRCHADYAFFMGASKDNAEQLAEWEQLPGCAGVKIFMGSSTGSLLVPDDETLERVLRSGERRCAVHAEDEPLLQKHKPAEGEATHVGEHPQRRPVESAVRATERLLALAEKTGRKVHILHISTAEEIEILRERDLGELVTAETTPNHLFLAAPECYERHGSLAQMNPPVRDKRHQDVLRQAVVDGVINVIGSDHAPHTPEEKAKPYPQCPSGIPGVQTILPLVLTAVRDGWLQWSDLLRLCVTDPVRIYGIQGHGSLEPGAFGNVVLVDPEITEPLPAEWLRTKVAKSPYAGMPLAGWPVTTILRGEVVYQHQGPVAEAAGQQLRYG